jgi:hypothetical protein
MQHVGAWSSVLPGPQTPFQLWWAVVMRSVLHFLRIKPSGQENNVVIDGERSLKFQGHLRPFTGLRQSCLILILRSMSP